VPRNEIIQAGQPIECKTSSVKTDMTINPYALETRLDIRGYSRSEAQAAVQEFFDSALMGTATQLKVLHGKGSGVLKKLVWAKAKEYKDIKKIWHPEEEFGGTGVSFISF
ncbi:MAG: Smr/MutS family protein, partial [Saprospiraceae bacterium]